MEHITRQQTILIALLVAIITAISTSVATVSLLDNPSSIVTPTIYKVIEKSIETVTNIPSVKEAVSSVKPAPSAPAQISPSDIASNGAKSIVRIYDKSGPEKKFVSLGIAVGGKNGVLATSDASHTASSQYIAVTNDGKEIKATFSKAGIVGGLSFFTLNYDAGEKSKVPPIQIKDSSGLKLGSNVVALGGKESGNVVSTGIIAEFAPLQGRAATTTDMMTTDMGLSSTLSGWLLFDTGGNLSAFETTIDEAGVAHFLNAGLVVTAITDLL